MASESKSKKRDKHISKQIHRFFWRAHFEDKLDLALAYLGRVPAVAAYNIFIPLASAFAIQAIFEKNSGDLRTYCFWILGLAVFYVIFWVGGSLACDRLGVTAAKYVDRQIFKNFLNKGYDFFSNSFFGSLGSQAARMSNSCIGYGEMITLSIPKQVTIVVAGITVIAFQSLALAGITLASMVVVLSYTLLSSSWRQKYRRRSSEAKSVVAAHFSDSISHGATVKSFAAEDYETERIKKPLNIWGRHQLIAWATSLPADGGRMILAALATVALLIFSANLYWSGAIELTIVILVQLYVIRLVASTLEISEIVKRYEEIMSHAYEPMKTMLVATEVNDPEKPKKLTAKKTYTLELEGVSYSYPDSDHKNALQDLQLKVKPGEKIGIVGYSGSGKTTLTKLLLRFMDVTDGRIKLDNIDIRDLRQKDLRRVISYVPQEPLLFHRSIYDNIAYGNPKASKKDIIRVAKHAYVDEFVEETSHGYDTIVGERGVKLSGGQRQRVAIARALLKDSPILVLDEATSALDSQSEQYIQKALWELMKGRTALVVAHRLSTIQRMDKIIVMDKGEIVQFGTHEQLKRKSGIYADLWKHQSGGYIGADDDNRQA